MTRSQIGDINTSSHLPIRNKSFSIRAAKQKLVVYKEDCPHCHHHKIIENTMFKKCAACKKRID